MSIEYKFIEDCIADNFNEGNELIPDFDICTNTRPTFSMLKLQCKGNIIANYESGPRHENSDYILKLFPESLRIAKDSNVDVFLTPEYSFPIEVVNQIIENEMFQPNIGKIWVICTQGIKVGIFDQLIKKWRQDTRIFFINDGIENYQINYFVNTLFYIFKLKNGAICIAPQIKTKSMADRSLECEEAGLSLGKHIFLFGKNKPNQMCSLICADSLNRRDINLYKLFPTGNECIILLHPQLNQKPRDENFAMLRKELFNESEGNRLVYITQNWAEDTSITIEGSMHTEKIDSPWSSIYIKNMDRNWIESNRDLRNNNFNKGLGFAFWGGKKTNIWFSSAREMLQQIHIRKPCNSGAIVTSPLVDVKVFKAYIPNDLRETWIEKEDIFDDDLNDLYNHLPEEYTFPIHASIEDRDLFFGVSLGMDEKSQLIAEKDELCCRLGVKIDIACKDSRDNEANRYLKLINCLQIINTPAHFRELRINHKFGISRTNNHNLFSKDNNGLSALVCFIERDEYADKFANSLIIKTPENKEKICVFTIRRGSVRDIITYPTFDKTIDAADRVKASINISEG